MPAPQRIKELVKKFEENFKFYQSNDYREEDLRNDFLNPFFAELGWDMEDKAGKGPGREVRYEMRIKAGAPDYGFYLDNRARFFVEAKNPSKNVCNDPIAALQLRAYGWSARVPRSVLTDFEEFSVYDTTVRPKAADQARVARLECVKYVDFVERWDDLAAMFSREAVLGGSLEKLEKKHVKQAVDEELLKDISDWRELLAKNIANRNKVSEERLNRIVQDTISRILFLRICEDRGIAHEGALREIAEGEGTFKKLYKLFKKAEQRYDSELFEIDSIADLIIDDKTLKEIISELYFPKSPYKFDAIPAEILGQVYEQFLGKVIRLTEGWHAKVEEKPEVRKAGGIYYTPTYIVEYIVRNTIGKLVEGKKPKDIETLSVVDPACGSGSFLLGAYKFLVDWYRDWYIKDGAEKHQKAKKIYLDGDKQWQLTLDERKRILLAHIYGVDIDRQAVEMAKLSLMLETLRAPEQQSLFNERMLPNLSNNIKCGNALIGNDYSTGQISIDPKELGRINPFDWEVEFPNIFKQGGFSVVIGNPPYANYSARDSMRAFYARHGMSFDLRILENSISYCARKYPEVSKGVIDTYKWFIAKGSTIAKEKGTLGHIVPNTWLSLSKYKDLKDYIFQSGQINIVDLGFGIFDVTVPTCILICRKGLPVSQEYADLKQVVEKINVLTTSINFHAFSDNQNQRSAPFLLRYLKEWPDNLRLGSLLVLREGQHIPRKELTSGHQPGAVPVIDSKNMGRYRFSWKPAYSYAGAKKFQMSQGRRIVIRKTGDRIVATLSPENKSFVLQSLYQSVDTKKEIDSKFILAILNSKFLTFVYQGSEFGQKGRVMAQFRKGGLDRMPMLEASEEEKVKLAKLADQMMMLHSQIERRMDESQQTAFKRQIDATDRQIDQLVYKLYKLTNEETRLIEESLK